MSISGFFGRLDRLAGRFNKWFGPAALASNTKVGDRSGRVDAAHVTAILGEIEKSSASRQEELENGSAK
jgi:hypothetical protein